MLMQQNGAMSQGISDRMKLISNIANQMSASMAALITVVIRKVDSIHRTFSKQTPTQTKTTQNNNNNTNNNNNNGGRQK